MRIDGLHGPALLALRPNLRDRLSSGLLRTFALGAGLFPLAAIWFSGDRPASEALLLSPVAFLVGIAFWMIVEDARQ